MTGLLTLLWGCLPRPVDVIAEWAADTVTESLTIASLTEWFRERADRVRENPSKIAVTVLEEPDAHGRAQLIQGIFDTDTQRFDDDVRRITAQDVDPAVTDAHAGHAVTIWD